MTTNSASKIDGLIKSTATYSCESSGFSYPIISEDIKTEFDFLKNELPQKLDNVVKELNEASSINNAFYISNQSEVKDITAAKEEIQKDINNFKNDLSLLHSSFMKKVDNVNAELEYNFGWILVGEVTGSTKIESTESNTSTIVK